MSSDEIDTTTTTAILPFCPRWSQILGEKTHCLGLECSRYSPILDPESRKVARVSGFCMDYLNMVTLDDLAISLSSIVEILGTSSNEIYSEEILDQSRKEGVNGYE